METYTPEQDVFRDFLQSCIPFDELDRLVIDRIMKHSGISYHRKGTVFSCGEPDAGLRILRSGAAEIRSESNVLLDRLAEGDSFNIDGLNEEQSGIRALLIEDSLICTIPENLYQSLRSEHAAIDRFFSGQRSRRIRRAVRHDAADAVSHEMMRPLKDVMSSDPVSVTPSQSIRETAELMTVSRISSVLVMDGDELAGIVTDRDLRARAVALNADLMEPVSSVMTESPYTMTPDATLFDATLFMTRNNIHHIPVMENNRVCGIVTASDLILARKHDPVFLVQHIGRQDDVNGLKVIVSAVPELMVSWVNSGVPVHQISHVLTALSDAVTARLIDLTIQELGPAPVPFCWLGFGSQGRREQLPGADQDNGLLISDDCRPEHESWFDELAQRVCDGLNECGYVYCPGEIMACNTQWRMSLKQWKATVDKWMKSPTEKAVMHVSIFFDIRAVYGDQDLAEKLRQHMLTQTSDNSIFLAALAQNVLSNPPPIGIFRRFLVERNGDHIHELNLKKRGIIPIVDIVRLQALAHGIPQINTLERLKALAECGAMNPVDSRNMSDALKLIMQLRAQHQAEQILRGEKGDNYINPGTLSRMKQKQIKDAFAVVQDAQQVIRLNFCQGMA